MCWECSGECMPPMIWLNFHGRYLFIFHFPFLYALEEKPTRHGETTSLRISFFLETYEGCEIAWGPTYSSMIIAMHDFAIPAPKLTFRSTLEFKPKNLSAYTKWYTNTGWSTNLKNTIGRKGKVVDLHAYKTQHSPRQHLTSTLGWATIISDDRTIEVIDTLQLWTKVNKLCIDFKS